MRQLLLIARPLWRTWLPPLPFSWTASEPSPNTLLPRVLWITVCLPHTEVLFNLTQTFFSVFIIPRFPPGGTKGFQWQSRTVWSLTRPASQYGHCLEPLPPSSLSRMCTWDNPLRAAAPVLQPFHSSHLQLGARNGATDVGLGKNLDVCCVSACVRACCRGQRGCFFAHTSMSLAFSTSHSWLYCILLE